jgi:hypothetical protein
VAAATIACLLLLVPQLGAWLRLRYAWGFNLWQYLPPGAVAVLAVALLLLCTRRAREVAIEAAVALARRLRPKGAWALAAASPFVFFALREREFFGDAVLYPLLFADGWRFVVPELGSSHLLWLSTRLADVLVCGWGSGFCYEASSSGVTRTCLQGLICGVGAAALVLWARAARLLAPGPGRRLFVLAFVFCGGLLRLLMGHVEVYAFVLAAAGAYVWAALAWLCGRCRWWVPCLALGIAFWLHQAFAVLAPSLLHLLLLRPAPHGRRWSRRLPVALLLGLGPTLLFLLAIALFWPGEDLGHAWTKTLQILGIEPDPLGLGLWLPSRAHLKFLLNSFFVLAPAGSAIALGFALFSPRSLVGTSESSFLAGICACTLLYACALQPVWGPYDWDLFSLAAVATAALAGHLMATRLAPRRLGHLGALSIGASLLLVTVPFVWVGIAPSRDAGPFRPGEAAALRAAVSELGEGPAWVEHVRRRLSPWL